jgi:hypothetical protein
MQCVIALLGGDQAGLDQQFSDAKARHLRGLGGFENRRRIPRIAAYSGCGRLRF